MFLLEFLSQLSPFPLGNLQFQGGKAFGTKFETSRNLEQLAENNRSSSCSISSRMLSRFPQEYIPHLFRSSYSSQEYSQKLHRSSSRCGRSSLFELCAVFLRSFFEKHQQLQGDNSVGSSRNDRNSKFCISPGINLACRNTSGFLPENPCSNYSRSTPAAPHDSL